MLSIVCKQGSRLPSAAKHPKLLPEGQAHSPCQSPIMQTQTCARRLSRLMMCSTKDM